MPHVDSKQPIEQNEGGGAIFEQTCMPSSSYPGKTIMSACEVMPSCQVLDDDDTLCWRLIRTLH